MEPADLYQRRALALLMQAETLSDPHERETLRELALSWLRQADYAAEFWNETSKEPQRAARISSQLDSNRLRLLHREQVDHLAPAPHRLVLRQHAGVGALLGIDPAFQAARHGRYVGCPHAVLLFGRNPLIDHCPVS